MWNTGQALLNQGIRFAAFVFLARLLGPEAFGLIALALSLTVIGEVLIVEGGWVEALVRGANADPVTEDTVFWTLAAVGVAAAAGVALAGPAFASLWSAPMLAQVLPWMALLFPLYAMKVLPTAMLLRSMNFRGLALSSSLGTVAGAAVAVAIAAAGGGVWSLVVYVLVQHALHVPVLWWLSSWHPGLSFSPRHIAPLVGFVGHVLLARCGSVVDIVAGRSALGLAGGPIGVGYYSFALDTHGHIRRLVVMPVTRVALPAITELQGEPERLRRAVLRGIRLFCLAAFPVPIGVAVVAPDLVPLLFGSTWAPAIPAVQLAMLFAPAAAFTRMTATLQLATGRARAAARLSILGSLVFVAALLVLPRITPETVLIALVLRSYVLLPLHVRAVIIATGVDARRLVTAMLQISVAVLVMAGLVWVASDAVIHDFHPAQRLLVASALGVAIYGLAVLLLARWVIADASDLFSVRRRDPETTTCSRQASTGGSSTPESVADQRTARTDGESSPE